MDNTLIPAPPGFFATLLLWRNDADNWGDNYEIARPAIVALRVMDNRVEPVLTIELPHDEDIEVMILLDDGGGQVRTVSLQGRGDRWGGCVFNNLDAAVAAFVDIIQWRIARPDQTPPPPSPRPWRPTLVS